MSSTAYTFILTSSPFTLNQVTLASLIPNIKAPHQDAKRPYAVQETDFSVQSDALFSGQAGMKSETFFDMLATKLAWLSAGKSKMSTLSISAKGGRIYSLNNPDDLFESIVFGSETGPAVREWLERCRQRGLAPWFVTGYRTFIDANLSHEQQSGGQVSGGVTVPGSSIMGDPLGIADAEIKAGGHGSTETQASQVAEGERIYAICYRKIKIKAIWGSGTNPSLGFTNTWKPCIESRGDDDENMHMQAVLSQDEVTNTDRLYQSNEGSDSNVMFGTASDVDSDSDSEFF